jgi:hypothetical protein
LDRRGPLGWKFAANATGALPRRKRPRASYEQKLRRALDRHFPGFSVTRPTTAVDLQKSFGPINARGLLSKGQTAFAVLGINASETQASIDASLTFAILWLEVCRQSSAGKFLVEGLHLFVPKGCSALVRERMANLHRAAAAKWSLFELDERHDALVEIDCADRGNVSTRSVHATNESAALERFAESIARITSIPLSEVNVLSPAELAFRWRGLEFARARMGAEAATFRSKQEIVFGVGAEERVLEERNGTFFLELLSAIRDSRHPYGPRQHPLFRLHPERWLESLVAADVSVIDGRLDPGSLYSQVPAFSASDRAMLDVLTTTHEGSLAVVELKADEDIHLPLQGRVTGQEWSGIMLVAHFRASDISPAVHCRPKPSSVSGSTRLARPSRNRHFAALHFARDRLGICRH